MDGYGITVDFDGARVEARPTNAVARGVLGADNLAIPVAQIRSLSMKSAGLISNGYLELRTNDGRRLQLPFNRKQQGGFDTLRAKLQATVGRAAGATRPRGSGDANRSAPAVPAGSPAATPFLLRGTGRFAQEVVGESHYGAQLSRVAGRERGGEREVVAQLRREPSNRYDRNAVQVLIDGCLVGYLPREDAPSYHAELRVVEGWQRAATCRARLWWQREPDGLFASVSLDLAEPGHLVPICWPDPAAQHVVMPAGRWYQIADESAHMDVLAPLLARVYVPGRAFAYASLHLVDRARARSTAQVAVVRIEGRDVGELSKQISARLVPLLAPLAAAQASCYAEAELTGNALAVEGRVSLTMPESLPQSFVQQVQALADG